jgi:hypothetical protein
VLRRKLPAAARCHAAAGTAAGDLANKRWTMGVMSDWLATGQRLRVFTLVDACSCW